ncbi:alkaline phosphatase family protein [Geofilum rhodophaeum]|uniref:alkaline phosphatase family protein n=1 Tax=Geofilum rhodophaeum TaxID=1965019 RepID=UPI000B5248F6|nr:alkaline phosphatase family protein [Geofilum rhodophaeum]
MRLLLLLLLLLCAPLSLLPAQSPETPRLLLYLVVDELSDEQLLLMQPHLGEKGFKRLAREGLRFMSAYSADHSAYPGTRLTSLYTGCPPAVHGIVGERWYDQKSGRFVDAAGGRPENYHQLRYHNQARSITDYLKAFYGPQSRSAVVSAAHSWMLHTAGYAPDHLVFWDTKSGYFRDYAENPPDSLWLQRFNNKRQPRRALSPGYANELTRDAAVALLAEGTLGRDPQPDVLSLGFSTGALESEYDLLSEEKKATLLHLDQVLAALLEFADRQVGRNNYLVVLTAARTPAADMGTSGRIGQTTGMVDFSKTSALLNLFLMAKHGQGKWVLDMHDNSVYLNRELIRQKGLSLQALQEETAGFLMEVAGIDRAWPLHHLLFGQTTDSSWNNNLYPSRSGDLLLRLQQGWHARPTAQGTRPYGNNGSSPLPLLVSGWQVAPGAWLQPFEHRHLSPLLLKQLGIIHPHILEAPLIQVFKKP